MFVPEEIKIKKQRLRTLMRTLGLEAIYLKRQSNFSWLTGGGQNVVGITLELGVAGLLLTEKREFAICNSIEAPRMAREELLEDQGYRIESFPWYRNSEAQVVARLGGKRIGADHVLPGAEDVSRHVNPLRYSLTQWEVERYLEIGELTSRAIEETALEIRPGDKECEVVGRLAARLWAERIDYITTFCAADDRIAAFRHPLATERRIEKRAMLCVNSRRQGLIVSLTRFVQFETLPEEMRRRYDANVLVDCTMMAHTVPGRPARDAFLKGLEAYTQAGYPKEYELHHQGGAIGYVGRDYKVDFDTQEVVQENQGFAWNPSITGSKSEDTMIATSAGPRLVSMPMLFPELKMKVEGHEFTRPDILQA